MLGLSAPVKLPREDIHRLFELLARELAGEGVVGEVYLVGGAVMCLALNARAATRNVDAFFRPSRIIRQAAARVAEQVGTRADWLNDAVKGFMGRRGKFETYLELPNLRVFVALPEYLLAMKCASLRLGEEFHDLEDVRYLLRHLNITGVAEAFRIVAMYFEEASIPAKTRYVLEELLPG